MKQGWVALGHARFDLLEAGPGELVSADGGLREFEGGTGRSGADLLQTDGEDRVGQVQRTAQLRDDRECVEGQFAAVPVTGDAVGVDLPVVEGVPSSLVTVERPASSPGIRTGLTRG